MWQYYNQTPLIDNIPLINAYNLIRYNCLEPHPHFYLKNISKTDTQLQ